MRVFILLDEVLSAMLDVSRREDHVTSDGETAYRQLQDKYS